MQKPFIKSRRTTNPKQVDFKKTKSGENDLQTNYWKLTLYHATLKVPSQWSFLVLIWVCFPFPTCVLLATNPNITKEFQPPDQKPRDKFWEQNTNNENHINYAIYLASNACKEHETEQGNQTTREPPPPNQTPKTPQKRRKTNNQQKLVTPTNRLPMTTDGQMQQ